MRKVLNTLAAALVLLLLTPLASFADDNNSDDDSGLKNPSNSNEIGHLYKAPKRDELRRVQKPSDHDEIERIHSELEESYEDYSGVVIPPSVISVVPEVDPNVFELPRSAEELILTGATNSFQIEIRQSKVILGSTPSHIDPYKLDPLPVANLVLTKVTPADEFMAGARGLGMGLGFSALGLLGITGFSTLRQRNRKSVYLYSSEK
jgi:hypothetical protein